jgi:hypothetical protein
MTSTPSYIFRNGTLDKQVVPQLEVFFTGRTWTYHKEKAIAMGKKLLDHPITAVRCSLSNRGPGNFHDVLESFGLEYKDFAMDKKAILRAIEFWLNEQIYYNTCAAMTDRLREEDETAVQDTIRMIQEIRLLPPGMTFYPYAIATELISHVSEETTIAAAGAKNWISKYAPQYEKRTLYEMSGSIVLKHSGDTTLVDYVMKVPQLAVPRPKIARVTKTKSGKHVVIFKKEKKTEDKGRRVIAKQ